jgi:hypothetical protein
VTLLHDLVDFGGHLKDFLLEFIELMERSKEWSDFYLLSRLLSNKFLTLWILTCNKISSSSGLPHMTINTM